MTAADLSRRDFLNACAGTFAVPALVACGGDPTEPGRGPRLTARPSTPPTNPALGRTELGLDSPRDGFLYVPQSYIPDVPMPLFVALHGAGGDADNWTSYPDRAEARGMILLAPDSRLATWDVRFGGFGPDVTFIDQALAFTFERCNVDPTHIALAGFSDGASYALSLGVSNGDLFTHLIGYSPGFLQPDDPIVGKPDVYVSHGLSDDILPVTASRNVIVPTLRDDGYVVEYNEFDGGHEVPAEISDEALDWWLA